MCAFVFFGYSLAMRHTSCIYIDIKFFFDKNRIFDKDRTLHLSPILANFLATLSCNPDTKLRIVYQPSDLTKAACATQNPDIYFRVNNRCVTDKYLLQTAKRWLDVTKTSRSIPTLPSNNLAYYYWEDLTTPLENPNNDAVFFSLCPELNRLARRSHCETIVDTYGQHDKQKAQNLIARILAVLENPTDEALLFVDFDDTITDNVHPFEIPGKPVLIQHTVDLMVLLVNQIKQKFSDEASQQAAFSRLHFQILSMRAQDELIAQNPNSHTPQVKPTLDIFIEEVFLLTQVKIKFSAVHCLSGFECVLFIDNKNDKIVDAILYDPNKHASHDYHKAIDSKMKSEQYNETLVYEYKQIDKAIFVLASILPVMPNLKLVGLVDDQEPQRYSMKKRIRHYHPDITALTVAVNSPQHNDHANARFNRIGDMSFNGKKIATYDPRIGKWQAIEQLARRASPVNHNPSSLFSAAALFHRQQPQDAEASSLEEPNMGDGDPDSRLEEEEYLPQLPQR